MAKRGRVEARQQRRAVAAGRDVATAQIGDDRDAGRFDETRGRIDLQREAELRSMADGQPVSADRADLVRLGPRIDERALQPGPLFAKARALYWDFAHG